MIHFRMSMLSSMAERNVDKVADTEAIDDEQRNAESAQPHGHAEPENDAQQGDVQDLEIHLVGKDSGPQKEADLYGQKDKRVKSKQQKDADDELPGKYEDADRLIEDARRGRITAAQK